MIVCPLITLYALDVNAAPANQSVKSKLNYPINLDGFGAPLHAVAKSVPDLATFAAGQISFKQIQTVPPLGPLFNGTTCAGCHSQPSMGGGSLIISEIRVRDDPAPSPVHVFAVDNMLRTE